MDEREYWRELLERERAENARLRGEVEALEENFARFRQQADERFNAAADEVQRLREALKPFAAEAGRRSWITNPSAASGLDDMNIGGSALTNGDVRHAFEVLAATQVPGGGAKVVACQQDAPRN